MACRLAYPGVYWQAFFVAMYGAAKIALVAWRNLLKLMA